MGLPSEAATSTGSEQKNAVSSHGGMLLEELDRRDRGRQVLVGEGEVVSVSQLLCVRVRDLVEPQRGDAAAGQPPGYVLERLVPPDRLVAVERSRAGEQ